MQKYFASKKKPYNVTKKNVKKKSNPSPNYGLAAKIRDDDAERNWG